MTAEVEGAAPTAFGKLTRWHEPYGRRRPSRWSHWVSPPSGSVDPGEALWYLLVFPIWIIARDFGVTIGFVAASCALALAMPLYVTQDVGTRRGWIHGAG